MHAHQQFRHIVEILEIADEPLHGDDDQQHIHRLQRLLWQWRAEEHPEDPQHQYAKDDDADGMQPRHIRDVKAQTLSVFVSAVRPRACDQGSVHKHPPRQRAHRPQHRSQPRVAEAESLRANAVADVVAGYGRAAGYRRAIPAIPLVGPMVQHDGVPQQHHREQKVRDHNPRLQFRSHHPAAQYHLRPHACHQPQRPPHEIVSPRRPPERTQHRQHHSHRNDARHQPVAEFNPSVILIFLSREELVVAAGPIGAAQPRASEPHGHPGEHDCPQCHDRPKGDATVSCWRDMNLHC